MLDKLTNISKRYDAINEKLSDPAVFSDREAFAALMKERKSLEPVVEKYGLYKTALEEIDEAKELLASRPDEELKEMAEEQLSEAKEAKTKLEEEIKILLLPRDPNDDRNVIMEIRSGAGGEEAALFAHSLYRMYTMYAESRVLRPKSFPSTRPNSEESRRSNFPSRAKGRSAV